MTIAAMEALDWLEGWLLAFGKEPSDDFAQSVPAALQNLDAIRSALPSAPMSLAASWPRMSSVSDQCDWLRKNWTRINPSLRRIIIDDLNAFVFWGDKCADVLGLGPTNCARKKLLAWIEAQP